MKTTITVGQSVQVFQEVGMPEKWNKITIQKEFDGDVPEQYEIDTLFEKVEMAHEKHSQSTIQPNGKDNRDIYLNVSTGKKEY